MILSRRLLSPLPLLLLLSSQCATSGVNKGDINLFSSSDEVSIGKDFSAAVEKEIILEQNTEVLSYIDELGQLIVEHSERQDISYHFKVVDSEEVNAFALPGGYIYINRGLILTASNEAELISVIAHEVGHVVARHGTEQLTRQYGFSIVSSLALGANPKFWEEQVAGLFGALGLLHYGRKAELEADHLGLEEMHRAGYKPEAMASFFEKLLELHNDSPGSLEKLFLTHPPTQERIDKAREFVGYLQLRPGERLDTDRFHAIQGLLKG